jgi:hypothetical protein
MHHQVIFALPILSLCSLVLTSPLEKREPQPRLLDDLLNSIITPVTQLIKDVLDGTKSAIDDTRSNKPLTCSLLNADRCCVCESLAEHRGAVADYNKGGMCPPNLRNNLSRLTVNATTMPALPSVWDFTMLDPGTKALAMVVQMALF